MARRTNPVVFGLFAVVYVLALPVMLLIRLFDPLRTRLGNRDSYWERHAPVESTLKRMKRPF